MKDRIIGTPDDRYYAAKLSQLFYRNLKNVCVLKGTRRRSVFRPVISAAGARRASRWSPPF